MRGGQRIFRPDKNDRHTCCIRRIHRIHFATRKPSLEVAPTTLVQVLDKQKHILSRRNVLPQPKKEQLHPGTANFDVWLSPSNLTYIGSRWISLTNMYIGQRSLSSTTSKSQSAPDGVCLCHRPKRSVFNFRFKRIGNRLLSHSMWQAIPIRGPIANVTTGNAHNVLWGPFWLKWVFRLYTTMSLTKCVRCSNKTYNKNLKCLKHNRETS